MAPLPPGSPLAIYIHIPFCSHICPYCDFNTYSGQGSLIPDYVEAVAREIAQVGDNTGGREAVSIFFGGGTPSQLSGGQIATLVMQCRESFAVLENVEITLESNPNDLDERLCVEYLEAGVNRISIGAQTLDRRGLRTLGRQHESEDTVRAYQAARRSGFRNISLDFISGWPGQTLDTWRNDLETVLDFPLQGPDHLSLYSLIIEPGTPMHEGVARGILTPADDDLAADMYELAIETLADANWVHYEVANWARCEKYQSVHNSIYWQNGEYVGIGAGAHGRLGDVRTMNQPLPRTFISAVTAGEWAVATRESITSETSMGETMMLGLRLLREGVESSQFAHRHGCSVFDRYGNEIAMLVNDGLLTATDDRLRLTPRGLMMANDVCGRFV